MAEQGSGMTVTPPGDTADVGTQLRLVDGPDRDRASRRRSDRPRATVRTARRAVQWHDWRLDERSRRIGREGVAQARAALEQASRRAS
jgi:hypothetical protein